MNEIVPVIKDIVLPVQAEHAPVIIANVILRVPLVLVPVQKQVPVADQRSPVHEILVRMVAYGIAKLVVVAGRIDEIIFSLIFADGTGLEKLVVCKGAHALLGKQ